jgi:hypothetical protein
MRETRSDIEILRGNLLNNIYLEDQKGRRRILRYNLGRQDATGPGKCAMASFAVNGVKLLGCTATLLVT